MPLVMVNGPTVATSRVGASAAQAIRPNARAHKTTAAILDVIRIRGLQKNAGVETPAHTLTRIWLGDYLSWQDRHRALAAFEILKKGSLPLSWGSWQLPHST